MPLRCEWNHHFHEWMCTEPMRTNERKKEFVLWPLKKTWFLVLTWTSAEILLRLYSNWMKRLLDGWLFAEVEVHWFSTLILWFYSKSGWWTTTKLVFSWSESSPFSLSFCHVAAQKANGYGSIRSNMKENPCSIITSSLFSSMPMVCN